jgi:hypothetical protein
MLEVDTPLPVVAFGPWPDQASGAGVDAVCVTPEGDIELLVSTFDEAPRDTLWRLLDVAGALRGTDPAAFADHCTELGSERSVARWLHARHGGDLDSIERRLADSLATGAFGFLLVTPRGAADLTPALEYLRAGGARVRVFELEVLAAGEVQAVEGVEVPLGAVVPATRDVPRRVDESVVVAPAPVVTPAPATEPEPELELAPATAPEPAPEAAPEPAPSLRASTADAFVAALDGLDDRTAADLRWLHESLLSLVDEAEYTSDGELEHVAGWLHAVERTPLFGLDGQGLLQLVVSSLPAAEQLEYATELASLLPDSDGAAIVAAGYVEFDVSTHAGDRTLLEFVVDNLVEALPGGREAFGTTREEDFFAGVSAASEPEEVLSALAEGGLAPTEPAGPEPAAEPAEADGVTGHSRWLRRRGAA